MTRLLNLRPARLQRFALLALILGLLTPVPAAPPNFVIILADDLGYGSVGCYGADPRLVRTPHIDRLAAEGMRFLDGNTPSSVCTPTRYGLLTGRYCWRSPLKFEVLGVNSPLLIESDRPTLPGLLRARGYRSAAIGKWHLGYGATGRTDYTAELKPGPLELGFDYHFGVPQNNGDRTGVFVENHRVAGLRSGKITPTERKTHYGPPYDGLDAPQRDEPEIMPKLAEKAEAWLDTVPAGQPFFLYLAATAVHEPIWPSASVAGTSAAGPFGDFLHDLDRLVGRILAVLDRKGVARDTLVLFTSDNGGLIVPADNLRNPSIHRAQAAGLKMNGDWRGRKHSVYEGGFRVPFIVRWPARVKAGATSPHMVGLVDVFATLNELLGGPPLAGADDSVSFAAQLTAAAAAPARDSMILHSAKGNFAIRRSPWKYIEGKPHPQVAPAQLKALAEEYQPQLYNLQTDPGETNNVLAARPEIARELQALLDRQRDATASRDLAAHRPP
jgi:arylsulfatase A-like enzyme